MDINIKLKERRKKIELIKKRENNKAIRNFKKEMKEYNKNEKNSINNINKLIEDEKKREEYEKQFEINLNEDNEKKVKINKENQKIKKKEFNNKTKILNNKRTREEIENDKQKKLKQRKQKFKNLHKTNKFGQPLMRYQIQNLLKKIKNKKEKGLL